MKWLDKLKTSTLEITTGDNKVYKPLYVNASKEMNLNAVSFEFHNVDGGLILRGKRSFGEFPIVLIFEGDECWNIANEFEDSIFNLNPWKLSHPIYGKLLVQPSKYKRDDSSLNIVTFEVTIFETIENTYPSFKRTSQGIMLSSSEYTNRGIDKSKTLKPNSLDISKIEITNNTIVNNLSNSAKSDYDLKKLNDKISKINGSILKIGSEIDVYMSDLSNLIKSPARFLDTIGKRIDIFKSAYNNLKNSVISFPSQVEKEMFEIIGGFIVTGASEASITTLSEISKEQNVNNTEILTRSQVIKNMQDINIMYSDYITTLGNLTTEKSAKLNSYAPDGEMIENLNNVVSDILGNLTNYLIDAKIEKIFECDKDYSLIEIVNKLTNNISNENINRFIELNKLSIDEVFIVKKGRILYYSL